MSHTQLRGQTVIIENTVTVILPTHNHASTLEYSIQSVLEQTFKDFALVIIGDGINEDSRLIIRKFLETDRRISFLDEPKSTRHGESHRDRVIRMSTSSYIAYHGDDDLMLPNHLETMLTEIGESDFIHALPIQVGIKGLLNYLPTDISIQECLHWHLSEKIQNAVSLTGVMHTKNSYLTLPIGWSEAPREIPSDLYMWKKYFATDGFRGRTSTSSTTIKLDNSLRSGMNDAERAKEIKQWWETIHAPEFQKKWDYLVREAVHKSAVQHFIAKLRTDAEYLQEKLRTEAEYSESINAIKNSTIWRATQPLRSALDAIKKLI